MIVIKNKPIIISQVHLQLFQQKGINQRILYAEDNAEMGYSFQAWTFSKTHTYLCQEHHIFHDFSMKLYVLALPGDEGFPVFDDEIM